VPINAQPQQIRYQALINQYNPEYLTLTQKLDYAKGISLELQKASLSVIGGAIALDAASMIPSVSISTEGVALRGTFYISSYSSLSRL